jgi:hypothetical protein
VSAFEIAVPTVRAIIHRLSVALSTPELGSFGVQASGLALIQ